MIFQSQTVIIVTYCYPNNRIIETNYFDVEKYDNYIECVQAAKIWLYEKVSSFFENTNDSSIFREIAYNKENDLDALISFTHQTSKVIANYNFYYGLIRKDIVYDLNHHDEITVGSRVKVNFRGRGKWYSGKIRTMRDDGTFDIFYDDGDGENSVLRENIILCELAAEN